MLSQNVLNLVDTAMVGSLGDGALAAVGLASFANFMAVAFITGMATGVQAMAARWLGAGRTSETAIALAGGLLLAISLAVPWCILLLAAAPTLFPLLSSDPVVRDFGLDYFQVRLLGMVGVGMNFAFRGYWNAVHQSRFYMGTMMLMHAVNISLNWVLIFGNLGAPALGVPGAALASTLATYVGTACYFGLALRHARAAGFLSGIPSRANLATMLRLSVPASVQQFFFAAGMTAFFWIVGRIGTSELAVAHVLINVMLVTILPGIGFGIAAGSLVGQALGANRVDEAYEWAWRVVQVAVVIVGVLALPAVFFPDLISQIFIHDPHTIELARLPMRIAAMVAPLDVIGMVLMQSHLGAGSSRRVMTVSLCTQWGLFLPAAYVLGPVAGFGLVTIWLANGAYRLLNMSIYAWSWRRRDWTRVAI